MEVQAILDAFDSHLNTVVKAICNDNGLEFDTIRKKYLDINHVQGENSHEPKATGRGISLNVKKKSKSDMIETTKYVYQDVTYLVDKKKNVYTFDVEKPVHVGIKLIDGTIKFFTPEQPQ